MPQSMKKLNLRALTKEELFSFVNEFGLPTFRAKQLAHWIYDKKVASIDDVTEFSLELRKKMSEAAELINLNLLQRLQSVDGSEKFLFQLEDRQSVESVLIPDKDRLTLCISTQVGCAMGCKFCLTGQRGFKRNLTFYEIVDQAVSVNRLLAPTSRVTNIVLMGMGEPLRNFGEVKKALSILLNDLGFSKRKVTLSTSGLIPEMNELAQSYPGLNLAVSLNATTDNCRNEIMPINKKYPIGQLIEACRAYPLPPTRRIAFEYVMLQGVNDSNEDAMRLVQLVKGIRAKINLIPFNEFPGASYRSPSTERVLAFQTILVNRHITAMIRKSRGRDILAACGQLKGGENDPTDK